MDERLKTVYKKLLIDHHDDARQEHLNDPYPHHVMFKESRSRPPPHRDPHREIHQYEQEYNRTDKPVPEDRYLFIFQLFFHAREKPVLGFAPCPFRRSAIAGIFYSLDDRSFIGSSGNVHGIRKQ